MSGNIQNSNPGFVSSVSKKGLLTKLKEVSVKKRLSNFSIAVFVGLMITSYLVCPAWAGKKDDTLNIATTKELESVDRYFNTARI